MTDRVRCVLRVHFHGLRTADPELYAQLLGVLHGISPRVEALPPTDADADVSGALAYFGQDAYGLAHLVRMRTLALHGVDTSIGSADCRAVAAMACAAAPPGRIVHLAPGAVDGLLRPRPVGFLYGAGPATVRTLSQYGLHTIGAVADTPVGTLQRILGRVQGRLVHERSHGIDHRPVTPAAPPLSATERHDFPRDELDPSRHRRAVRGLVEQVAWRLRTEQQATGRIELTVRYADGSSTARGRTLEEPTAHAPLLAHTAYGIYESLSLQRARVRGIALRAEAIRPTAATAAQLTFDRTVENGRRLEEVADRARSRWGPGIIKPARMG
ncbi:DNA polymerase Y family protein [Streptomyces sp. NPDC001889]